MPIYITAASLTTALFSLWAGAAFNASTAGKVLAVAGVVYAVLQALKQAFPAISGWWAVALNIVFSSVGVLIAVPTDQVFSVATLTAVLTAAIAAAGVHGTVKNAVLGGGGTQASAAGAGGAK